MKKVLIILITLASITLNATAAIGDWKIYMSYSDPQQIQETGNYLFVQASNSLYLYNKNDQSIQTFDKATGMSDVVINHISWNQKANRLVVVYDNSNIDLIDLQGNVTNVPDLYNKSMTEDKTVNSIVNNDKYAYIATNFGGIKLNVEKAEIVESYFLGFGAKIIQEGNSDIYLQSIANNKVYKCPKTSNPLDKSNWQITTSWSDVSLVIDLTAWNNNIEMVKTLKPEGPGSNNLRVTKWHNGKLYALSGILPKETTPTISMYDDSWHSFETVGISDKTGHKFINANCIEIDPMDDNHVYVGAQTGLYEYRDFRFIKEYNRHNSILQTAQPMEDKAGYPDEKKKNYTEVTSLKYDKKGTLWIANSYAKRPTICYISPNDTIKEYVHDNLMTKGYSFSMAQMSGMMIDSRGLLWFTNNNWTMPALVKYDIENNTTNVYTELINQDNTSYEFYNMPAIAEDKEGNIWVGTNVGLFCIMSSEINGNSNNIIFSQIKVPRNDGTNLADYLLNGLYINCIAIDSANRKWIGTEGNGVFLISSDNMEEIHHFTIDNSMLLSNNITSISINEETGQTFFGTDKGLCSYYSDSSKPNEEMTKDNVYAYPNPVEPSYNGLVTVVGLSMNTNIKIVTSSGQIVNEGKSNGGTYTWDVTDKNGKRVSSGVYNVITATSDGKKGTVCKIAVIN